MNTLIYLQEEIKKLKYELAVVIPQEIKEAVVSGDLKENSEYSSIITRQHFIGVRLEQLLKRMEAYNSIDLLNISKNEINIGSIVKLRDLKTNKIVYVKIVMGDIDEIEGDITEVTIASPFGQALKNKKVKDEITVQLPKSTARYRILQIKTIYDY